MTDADREDREFEAAVGELADELEISVEAARRIVGAAQISGKVQPDGRIVTV